MPFLSYLIYFFLYFFIYFFQHISLNSKTSLSHCFQNRLFFIFFLSFFLLTALRWVLCVDMNSTSHAFTALVPPHSLCLSLTSPPFSFLLRVSLISWFHLYICHKQLYLLQSRPQRDFTCQVIHLSSSCHQSLNAAIMASLRNSLTASRSSDSYFSSALLQNLSPITMKSSNFKLYRLGAVCKTKNYT